MKVIKSINNNVSLCLDSKRREVVVFGKGIGFYRPDEEIPLSKINRTFYNIKDSDFGILRTIPTVIINCAITILDMVSDQLQYVYPSSSAIALADHLQFAIQRKDSNIYLAQPLIQDLRMLYPKEMNLAKKSLGIIQKMTGVKLPPMEAGTLALHFINDRIDQSKVEKLDTAAMCEECTEIIEDCFSLHIDRDSFNYSRFVTHLDYLIRRMTIREQIVTQNQDLYEQLKQSYPESVACAQSLGEYLFMKTGFDLNDEERLYLAIHINRLVTRAE